MVMALRRIRLQLVRYILLLMLASLAAIVIFYQWASTYSLQNTVSDHVTGRQAAESNRYDMNAVESKLRDVTVKEATTKGFLTIGIPTVKRQKNASYLLTTLSSLINNSNESDRRQITLLIFLADMDNTSRTHVQNKILGAFGSYVDSGLIRMTRAPAELYPTFEGLPKIYGHSPTNIQWRSKQNFDYAFMMLLSKGMAEYYLQLEDDVLTVPGYIDTITQFIAKHRRERWTCLEFSVLGFIAKLYHSYDLEHLAKMLIMFNYEQPNDEIYLYFNKLKHQRRRIIQKPTIFKHLGLYSSLTEKLEILTDPLFQERENNTVVLQNTVRNPPARLISTFKIYEDNTPDSCYFQNGIMYIRQPVKGDRLTIAFDQTHLIHSVIVVTSSGDHPADVLEIGVLQIGQTVVHDACSDIIAVESFKTGQVSIKLDTKLQNIPIACAQILNLSTQIFWIEVVEISVHALV